MDIRCLKTFIYAAELGSFTRAAQVQGYSQPTVSFQIRQLEEELNAHLFERINRTVVLTDKGREVMAYALRIDTLMEEMRQALAAEKPVSGRIRLAAAASLCPMVLGESFAAFRERYPDISLKIIAAETGEMFRLLNHNEADLVLTLDSHIYQAEYRILQEEQIGVHAVCAPSHPLAKCGGISLEELTRHPFLLTEKDMSYRRMLDESMASRSLEICPVLELGDTKELGRLAAEGIGLAFLPDYVTEKLVREKRLVRLSVPGLSVQVWRQLICHRGKWISPALQAVIEYCVGDWRKEGEKR